MELIKNERVIFSEKPHLYTLIDEDTYEGKTLSGITSIIKTTICPNLYSDIPQEILERAAEHGTLCHKMCEQFDNAELQVVGDNNELANEDGVINLPELYEYRRLIAENEMFVIASEYLVSDNENFASCIDKVIELDKKSVAIVDLKFTYQYHEEPVTWQTSFYADMLEAQNPGIKVKKLYCIHIHNYKDGCRGEVHELERVPTELLESAKLHHLAIMSGETPEPFVNPRLRVERELGFEQKYEYALADILKKEKELSKQKEDIMNDIKKMFDNTPMTSKFVGELVTFSQSAPVRKKCFDEKRFAQEHPDLYRQYITTKVVAPRTTVSFNK